MDKSLIINEIKNHLQYKTDTELAEFLGVKQPTISTWRKRNTIDYELIIAKCNDIDANWLITGKGKMLKKETTNKSTFSVNETSLIYNKTEGIPLIPIDAMAGFGEGSLQVMQYDTEQYKVPEFTELNVDFMIRVKGSSMYPKYNSGDLVACKKLSIKDLFFQWNKVYVLDTEQGALIKRIKKSDTDNCIKIVSDNPNYDPFDMPLDKIYAISLVVGVIRLE